MMSIRDFFQKFQKLSNYFKAF